MTNEMKLLRAFIEAQSFEIEPVMGEGGVIGINRKGNAVKGEVVVDYKVTKKEVKVIEFTDSQYDLLVETLSDVSDEGPAGEGWKSDKLVALYEQITGNKY